MSALLSIILLSVWGLVILYLAFGNEWITFYIIATAFILSLFLVNTVLVFFSWAPGVQDCISAVGWIIGVLFVVKFVSLINN